MRQMHSMLKKSTLFLWLLIVSFLFLFSNPGSQEKIVEVVEVVNIEVVVRVYQEGSPQPVSGLQKKDFKLIVNGKEKDIHGFFEERKKIAAPSPSPPKKVEENPPSSLTSNLFVLIFNIHTCTKEMKESLDTVFEKVIRPNDRVIVFTNQALMNETVVSDTQETKTQVWEMLQAQSNEMKKKIKQMEMEIYQLTSECDMLYGPETNIDTGFYYQQRYAQIKSDFMQAYFNPGVKEYIAIAEYLRVKKSKKWVLIFYQPGVFPAAGKKNEYLPNPLEIPEQVETRLLNSIGKSFINTGATVHTLLMMTPRLMGNLPEGYEYQYTTTQSETILRDITKRTGGRVIQTTHIDKFVEKISKVEDVYYVLTFDPGNLKNLAYKIDVQTVGSNNYRLVYDNGRRSDDFIKQTGIIKDQTTAVSPGVKYQNEAQVTDLNTIFYDNLGVDLAKEGRYEEAIDYFSKAIRFNPESEQLYFNRGVTYFKIKQTDNALSDYSTALELNPHYSEALYNRGLLFMQKEKFENAVSDFTRAIELKPNHGYSRYYRAMAFEKQGKIQQALQDYNALKEADPVFYSTHFTEIKDKIKELKDRIEYE